MIVASNKFKMLYLTKYEETVADLSLHIFTEPTE